MRISAWLNRWAKKINRWGFLRFQAFSLKRIQSMTWIGFTLYHGKSPSARNATYVSKGEVSHPNIMMDFLSIWNEHWPKPWLYFLYIGDHATLLYREYIYIYNYMINHAEDPVMNQSVIHGMPCQGFCWRCWNVIVQAKGCVTSLLFVKKQGTSSVEKCAFRRGVLNNALLQTNDGPPSYPQHK